jgi:hypothetical protein
MGAYTFPLYREPYLFKDSNPEQYAAMFNTATDPYKVLPMLYTAVSTRLR